MDLKNWTHKRWTILHRDNYTCQRCKSFNPQLGTVEIYDNSSNSWELHEYESSPAYSLYRISSQKHGITIELDFDTDWLVLPILQIHHKRYIKEKEISDYADNDLITLCKQCHTVLHANEEIPIYDSFGTLIEYKKYPPEDYSSGRNHDYKPWVFIRKDKIKGEYILTDIKPRVSYILFGDEDADKFAKISNVMTSDFFSKYLPDYKTGLDSE